MLRSKESLCLQSQRQRLIVLPTLVVVMVASATWLMGCGGATGSANTAHLKGKITLDGQPIPSDASSSITFKPTRSGQGRTTFSTIDDGVYDSPDTPKGPVKIYLSIQQPTGRMISEDGGSEFAEFRSLVPDSYSGGIDMEIGEDNLNLDFDLK